MLGFKYTLMGVGPICDANFSVLFNKDSVKICDPNRYVMLTGWREKLGTKLWRMALLPDNLDANSIITPVKAASRQYPAAFLAQLDQADTQQATLAAYSAHDLPSVEALVRYFHAAAGFPVKSTWLKAIKAGNFALWPGLTFENASKYCPSAYETILGHIVQER